MDDVVLDTNVFGAGLRSQGGASREVLRRALRGYCRPLFGTTLWLEYEALLDRDVWTNETTAEEREEVLAALAHCSRWVTTYYGWRPNLRDENDNHLIELAVAGNARAVITHNVADLASGELRWARLQILTPAQYLEVDS